jgi:hypothetical protein
VAAAVGGAGKMKISNFKSQILFPEESFMSLFDALKQ